MADESYAVVRVSLEAKIGNFEFDDVVQYAAGFAMNDIPTASIMVAVGRNVQNDKLATIHKAVDTLRSVTMPAYVWLLVTTLDRRNASSGLEVVSKKRIKIFEGDAVGTGWQRSATGAQFTINLLHWLARLNYTSAVSASSHPGNPSDWSYPALHGALGLGSAASAGGNSPGVPSWVPMVHNGLINEAALRDIWGKALHMWMSDIAKRDFIDSRLIGNQVGGGSVTVLDVLKRIGPNGDGQPLNVELGGADAALVAEGLRHALQFESGNSWINTTLWGKLVGEWSPAYWFAVIPRIEDALIVPFTGGLSGDHWARIGDNDYTQCDINAQLRQVLRAVGIVHPVTWQTGANLNAGAIADNRGGLCGWYQPPKLDQGMVLLKDAPSWLSQPLFESAFSLRSQAASGGTVGTAVDNKEAGNPQTPARDLAAMQKQHRGIMDNYAHQWYTIECLKGRTGELAGKLRFDISPGSNILIEAGSARNVPQVEDGLAVDIYATVTRVTYVINAETQQAGTGFSLAHIRTKAENEDEVTSTSKPPLYQNAWRGAVLHKDFTPKK